MYLHVKWIIIISFLSITASPANANIINTKLSFFSIKPLTCVVQKIGDTCQLMATVRWKADIPANLCLVQDETKIYCWKNKKMGTQVIPIELKDTTNFTLIDDGNTVFASQKVNINAIQPTKTRRRLRSAWSIF
ncbi:MAG: DUF3019 domain-containing protein [Alteromonadaceae bacterium]|nr:DUF3019 domain-containing protein [Alteromonadaceae bacterium]